MLQFKTNVRAKSAHLNKIVYSAVLFWKYFNHFCIR